MEKWIRDWVHLSLEEAGVLIAVVALVLSLLSLVPRVREGLGRARRRAALVLGFTRRRYARAFVREHGTLRNIYLDREERLDLGGTYVSLSFYSAARATEERVLATRVLADTTVRRFLVVGDPGTGKSTLLKAYGTGILRGGGRAAARIRDQGDLRVVARSNEVPFFIPLRQFAKRADGSADSLRRYLVDEVVGRLAGARSAEVLFDRLVNRGRALVLLDGLDEVPEGRYAQVKDAILAFSAEGAPTSAARVVVSCRRQNFLRFRDDWIPVFADQSHAVAPLRDTEIYRFLDKRRAEFVDGRSPTAFLADIKASRSAELHRIPLILTISMALYLRLPAYEIPGSVARFYEQMIRELLLRHNFRADGGKAEQANRFDDEEKYWFLREFALAMARRADRFEDFAYAEIVAVTDSLVRRMAKVRADQVHDFIEEIIDRSGLVTRISDEDEYIFAHRSIHEYLAAVQLARRPEEGARLLWDRARDDAWRQVCVFFAALDHEYVDDFVSGLANRSPEVAGHCLSVANRLTTAVAMPVIARLSDDAAAMPELSGNLAALMAAARSPMPAVRATAVDALRDTLPMVIHRPEVSELLGADTEALRGLLDAFAETNAPEIVAIVPSLTALVPDTEPRLVGPLWNCLAVAGMAEHRNTASILVVMLLRIAVDPACLEELQAQPGNRPPFDSVELRASAYPFQRGIDTESNLVTLLAWARQLEIRFPDTEPPNRFLAGFLHSEEFGRLERDHFRRTTAIEPYKYANAFNAVMAVAAPVAVTTDIARNGLNGVEIGGIGWWSLFVVLVSAFAGFVIMLVAEDVVGIGVEGNGESPNPIERFFLKVDGSFLPDLLQLVVYALFIEWSAWYLLAVAPLAGIISTWLYVVLSPIIVFVGYWLPSATWFYRGKRIVLRRANEFEDVYDDPRSRAWLGLDPRP